MQRQKGKGMVLDMAPLTGEQYSALQPWKWQWLALAIVPQRKLEALIARATDFGPEVMQPDVLRPSQPR